MSLIDILSHLAVFAVMVFYASWNMYAAHWLQHSSWAARNFRYIYLGHAMHHRIYNKNRLFSEKYRVTPAPYHGYLVNLAPSIFWLATAWILCVLILDSWSFFGVAFVAGFLASYATDKSHDFMHTKNETWNKFRFARESGAAHLYHHYIPDKNFGFGVVFWDKLLGTYEAPAHGFLDLNGRGWRAHQRPRVIAPLLIQAGGKKLRTHTRNISESGINIDRGKFELKKGDFVGVVLSFPFQELRLKAEVIHAEPGGDTGLRFIKVEPETIRALHNILVVYYTPRFKIRVPAEFSWNGVAERGRTFKLSMTGFFMEANLLPEEGETLEFALKTRAGIIRVTGRVVWTNPEGEYGKPRGFSVRIAGFENKAAYLKFFRKNKRGGGFLSIVK